MNSCIFAVFVVLSLLTKEISAFSVSGNKILDSNGNAVLLRGVDRCSFEWNPQGQYASQSDYQLMKGWGANVVRITSNQDYWLSGSTSYNSGYAATIAQQVSWIKGLGMAVIIDLHWSDQGSLSNSPGQQCMADSNSITFWTQVATAYKNDPQVIFELYNEPHDVAWSIWLNGGSACGFTVAGFQQLYNAVRGTGANNVVLVGGLQYAYDLSGVASNKVTGTNVAYATHPYDYSGKQSGDWDSGFGYLVPTYPVVATEFGQYCNNDNYVTTLLAYFQTKGIHWTAWAWWVQDCNFPSIIADWNGNPLGTVGTAVKNALATSGTVGSVATVASSAATSAKASTSTAAATTAAATSSSTSSATSTGGGSASQVVFDDQLENSWQDWSYGGTHSLTSTTKVHSGSKSISFEDTNYAALYLHNPTAFAENKYANIKFYLYPTSSSQKFQVLAYTSGTVGNAVSITTPAANTWTLVTVPFSSFGVASSTQLNGFAIQASTSSDLGVAYFDDITLG